MVLPASRLHAFAATVALIAGGSPSIFISAALELTVADCSDLAELTTDAMTEDVNLFLDDATAFTCAKATTVTVDGPYEFRVTSYNESVTFTNLRFEISDGAKFSLDLAVEELMGTATFTGITGLASDGGVFNVDSGSSATFSVPVAFESNSVAAGYSGGAVYAAGNVDFEYDAVFSGNKVLTDGPGIAANGGGMCVASSGDVLFEDFTSFTDNEAESGGLGGAIANFGHLVFKRASTFASNTAQEDLDETGGYGGAIFTDFGSTTVFERRVAMRSNSGASGGALYNLGTTVLESAGFIKRNEAMGTNRAYGGHIYTNGSVSIAGDVNFRDGFSTGDAGAVYIDHWGSLTTDGNVTYSENEAFYSCTDVYASGEDPVCQP